MTANNRGQVAIFYTQKPNEYNYYIKGTVKRPARKLTLRKLWRWLNEWGFPRGKYIWAPTCVLVYLQNKKKLKMMIRRLRAIILIKIIILCPISSFQTQTPLTNEETISMKASVT